MFGDSHVGSFVFMLASVILSENMSQLFKFKVFGENVLFSFSVKRMSGGRTVFQ